MPWPCVDTLLSTPFWPYSSATSHFQLSCFAFPIASFHGLERPWWMLCWTWATSSLPWHCTWTWRGLKSFFYRTSGFTCLCTCALHMCCACVDPWKLQIGLRFFRSQPLHPSGECGSVFFSVWRTHVDYLQWWPCCLETASWRAFWRAGFAHLASVSPCRQDQLLWNAASFWIRADRISP